jgi:PAS domain S-box-containing protein
MTAFSSSGYTMDLLVLILSIVVQFSAAVVALGLIRKTGRSRAWLLVAGALFLMGVRRTITFVQAISSGVASVDPVAESVALVISVLMLVGVWQVGAVFERMNRLRGEAEDELEKRREAERALRGSKEKYRRMFDLFPEAIVLLGTDGRVLDVNERLDDWLGYSPEEVIGKDLWQLPYLPSHSKEELRTRFAQRMEGHKGEPYELDFVTRSGEKRIGLVHAAPLKEEDGRVTADLVMISDITERKEAEEKLRESEQKYRSLFYETPLGIFRYDGNAVITECNDRFVEIIGSSKEALVGLNMIKDLTNERMIGEVASSLDNGEGYYEGSSTSVTGGQTRELRVMFKGMRNGRGEIYAGMGLVEEVTGRWRTQRELEKTNRELEEALEDLRTTRQQVVEQERQRVLSTMASGIAHDFNNFLSTILGFAELLLHSEEKLQDTKVARGHLERIRSAATKAAETVRRMRKFYRPGEEESFVPLDVNVLVEEAVSMTRPGGKRRPARTGRRSRWRPIPVMSRSSGATRRSCTRCSPT